MRDKLRSTPRRTLRAALAILAAGAALATVYSCSLIVDQQSQQCQTDADCSQFAGAKCNTASGVCVSATMGSGGGTSTSSTSSTTSTGSTTTSSSSTSTSGAPSCDVDGGIDAGGCYDTGSTTLMCVAATNSELLNQCAAGCSPFNNAARLKNWDGGALPQLPMPGPDGGM